jgi:hypothetical protein
MANHASFTPSSHATPSRLEEAVKSADPWVVSRLVERLALTDPATFRAFAGPEFESLIWEARIEDLRRRPKPREAKP